MTSRPCAEHGPDVHALARAARSTFAGAREATLFIEGVEPADDSASFALADDGGRPLLWLPGGSVASACAVEARAAILKIDSWGDDVARVVLVGRLTLVDVERVDGACLDVVSLTLAHVFLEHDGWPKGAREIPVDLYMQNPDDCEPLTIKAHRMAEHVNETHQVELLRYITARFAIPVDRVAGVQITALDQVGAELTWVDLDGAHSATLRFPGPASTPSALADMIRDQLGRV